MRILKRGQICAIKYSFSQSAIPINSDIGKRPNLHLEKGVVTANKKMIVMTVIIIILF